MEQPPELAQQLARQIKDMDTPFFNKAKQLARLRARFFVPGHKGNPEAIPPFAEMLAYDLTEIEGADDLTCPSGVLAESEANMSRVYRTGATLYSASGSSGVIGAMLTLFAGTGRRVAVQRGCHVSALRAMAFLDIEPLWILPENGRITPEAADTALTRSGATALYVTSPDYYGRMCDVAALSAVCRRYGAALLVDNAHGAHLPFLTPNRHPIRMGADACADSAHKTLPCLTPAALFHLADSSLAHKGREALNLFCSTSPSHPVLQSLDLAAALLLKAPPDFEQAAQRLCRAAAAVPQMVQPSDDPLKLCLLPAAGGYGAGEVSAALRKAGIGPEIDDGTHIVLMASPYNTPEGYALLAGVLAQFPAREPLPAADTPALLPEVRCSLREALFGEKTSLPVADCAGRVIAGLYAPCPPGVPVLVPGEVVSAEAAGILAAGSISFIDVLL